MAEGMYWGDVIALIERNKKPWRVMRYYHDKERESDFMTVCDLTKPRRDGVFNTAEGAAHDNFRDSQICNAAYFNGFIPLVDEDGEWNEDIRQWSNKPYRGLRGLLKELVSNNVLEKTEEIRRILNEY